MFGVGGGFLMTPLLIFTGIPSTVAIATTLSHITASSMSGALAQWRKRAVDFTMAGVMFVGGMAGTVCGVWLVALMHRQGQMDLIVALSYVIMLGAVGGLMLRESLATLRAYRSGKHPCNTCGPWRSRVDSGIAIQDALPPVTPIYQRDPAGGDRICNGCA